MHEKEKSTTAKVLEISLEGYQRTDDPEFLDALQNLLKVDGLDTSRLVYSGFDGSFIEEHKPCPRGPGTFAMNEAGWREALKAEHQCPAKYAEGWDAPCIGVYDGSLLREVYDADISDYPEDPYKRADIEIKEFGEDLKDLEPGTPVMEIVAHVNYPDDPEASPTDALLRLVIIKDS